MIKKFKDIHFKVIFFYILLSVYFKYFYISIYQFKDAKVSNKAWDITKVHNNFITFPK